MQERIDIPEDVSRSLVTVLAVARFGSLSQASRHLSLTPSAVSKTVSKLEKQVGARLFQRTTRKVELTDAGKSFVQRAERIVDEVSELYSTARQVDDEPRGVLRVTAPPMFGDAHVVPVVAQVLAKYPALSIELDLSDRVVDVVGERIDVAVRFAKSPVPTSWSARKLGDERRVLVASPAYFARFPAPKKPADLAAHQVIVSSRLREGRMIRMCRTPGSDESMLVRVNGALDLNGSTRGVLNATIAGAGIGELESYMVRDELKSGRLVSVLDKYLPVIRTMWVMHAPGPYVPGRVRVFVDAMVKACRAKEW